MNSCPVGMGTVGDHGAHTVTPSGSLFNEEPAQRCFRPFWEHGQHLCGVAIDDHGHIPVAFSDRCLVYQQHPTLLFTTPCLDQPGPVGNQFHDQMPANSVAAGHRTDGHHLGVLDQPARQPTSKTSLELRMGLDVPFPAMVAHQPSLSPQQHRPATAVSRSRISRWRRSCTRRHEHPHCGHLDNFLTEITPTTNSVGVSTTTPVTRTPGK